MKIIYKEFIVGKKRHSTGYRSKGERKNVSNWSKRAARKDWNGSFGQLIAKHDAWKKGKRVMLTIENPNKNETNRPFIRVEASKVWGNSNVIKKKSAA